MFKASISGTRARNFVLAGLAVLAAFAAWKDAALAYWQTQPPESAPRSLRSDPRITLALAERSRSDSTAAETVDVRPAMGRAKAVLRSAPLDTVAMRELALASKLTGDRNFKRQLVLAERTSRRDLLTELALFDVAAAEGDDRRALSHLDRVLTVYPGLGPKAYAHLTTYIPNAGFRRDLAAFRHRAWFPAFLLAAANRSGAASDVAVLMLESRMQLANGNAAMFVRTLNRLIDEGQFALARELALRLGGATTTALDDFGLTPATTNPNLTPLTWRLASNGLVQAQLRRDGTLEIEAQPGKSATIAERVTRLPAGEYALALDLERMDEGPADLLAWEMRCNAKGAGPAWQQPVPLRERSFRFRAAISLPADCSEQHWRLRAMAVDRQTPARFTITAMALRRNS